MDLILKCCFWFLFLILSIEDNFFQEVSIVKVFFCFILFGLSYSVLPLFFILLLLKFFSNNKYIGEADLIFLPIGLYISGVFNISFYIFLLVFGILNYNLKTNISPFLFPILLSTVISLKINIL